MTPRHPESLLEIVRGTSDRGDALGAWSLAVAMAGALEVLAWSGRRPDPPAGKALLAERDGVPVAAIALTSGSILTDPDERIGDAERLLKRTRYAILRQGTGTGAARALLRRVQTRNRSVMPANKTGAER